MIAFYIVWSARKISELRANPWTMRFSQALVGLFILQLVIGVVNLVLLAPVWMQVIHLLMADFVWMAFVLLGASALADEAKIPSVAKVEQTLSTVRG